MSCRPLSLSQAQLLVVMGAARGICACERDRFLQSIADQLSGLDNFSDADVVRAVTLAMLHMGEAA